MEERIRMLEIENEMLKRKLIVALSDKIYLFFHKTKSILETSKHFDLSVQDVMTFIEEYDNCLDGLQLANDYSTFSTFEKSGAK